MKRLFLLGITCTAIVACGGGGGDGLAGGGNLPAPAAGLKIDSSNAQAASKASYDSAAGSVEVGTLLTDSGPIAANPAGSMKAAQQFSKLTGSDVMQASVPITQDCLRGSYTVDATLANPFTITPGDSFNIVFNACDEGLGEVLNGTLDFTIDALSGDLAGGMYELQVSMSLTEFQVVTAADTVTSDGDATVVLDTTNNPLVLASASGSWLQTVSNASTDTLRNFSSSQSANAGLEPAPYSWDASGTLDTTQLAGTVTYSTPVTFEGYDLDYPYAGELLVVGDSSSARIVAIDSVNLRIDIDSDGDGTVDESIDTTWAEFDN
jgi:hypothetical protein